MKVGDLSLVKGLPSSDYGIIIGTYTRGSGHISQEYWTVYFITLKNNVPFMECELEAIKECR